MGHSEDLQNAFKASKHSNDGKDVKDAFKGLQKERMRREVASKKEATEIRRAVLAVVVVVVKNKKPETVTEMPKTAKK